MHSALSAYQLLGAGFHPSFTLNHLVLAVSFRYTQFTDEETEAHSGPIASLEAAELSASFLGCK